MMVKRKVYRKRRVAKRKAVSRVPRSGIRKIEKVYSYQMTPNQAYLTNGASPGIPVVSPLSLPLAITNISGIAASKTGFTNYYDFGVSIPFQLTDLANYTAFTGIYDNYRINSVSLELEFMSNTASVNGAGVMPTVYAIQDHDDAVPPNKLSQLTGKQGYRSFRFGDRSKSTFKITVRPKVAALVSNPLTGNANIGFQQGQGWQDNNYPNNSHYGLKLWFTDVLLASTTPGNVFTGFRWKWKYNISFKGAQNEF